jgi:hypothetical protein
MSIEIISIVNASDPDLPLVGGGQMAIRLVNPGHPDLQVKLNGDAARGVKPGFDADGVAVLLVDLNTSQPGPLAAGSLAVQVSRTTPDGMRSIAESQIVHTSIVPSFAAPPAIENGQLAARMTLPVAPQSMAAALLFPRGTPPAIAQYPLRTARGALDRACCTARRRAGRQVSGERRDRWRGDAARILGRGLYRPGRRRSGGGVSH